MFWPDQAININQMARAFAQRMTAAAASNPRFSLSETQEAVAINALSNVMLMFGDGTVNTTANKLWVRVLFGEQELFFCLNSLAHGRSTDEKMSVGILH